MNFDIYLKTMVSDFLLWDKVLGLERGREVDSFPES